MSATATPLQVPWRPAGRAAAAAALWWVAYSLNRPVWDWAVFDAAGLERGSRLADAVHFFVYDTTKIVLLLTGIIFAVTVLRSFMSVERTRAFMMAVVALSAPEMILLRRVLKPRLIAIFAAVVAAAIVAVGFLFNAVL